MTRLLPLPEGCRVGHSTEPRSLHRVHGRATAAWDARRRGRSGQMAVPGHASWRGCRHSQTPRDRRPCYSPAEAHSVLRQPTASRGGWKSGDSAGRPQLGPCRSFQPRWDLDLVVGKCRVRPGPGGGPRGVRARSGCPPGAGIGGSGVRRCGGKLLRARSGHPRGSGLCSECPESGEIVAAIAVANGFGDVIAEDGELLGAPRDERGEFVRTAELVPEMPEPPDVSMRRRQYHARVRMYRRLA